MNVAGSIPARVTNFYTQNEFKKDGWQSGLMRSPVKRIPNGAVGSNPTPFKKKAVVAELVYAYVLEACVL